MELSVTQENISKALQNISRVASSKTDLPILSNILLKTEGNRLLIAATNLEISSAQYIGAKVNKQGSITIPSKLINDFILNLPNEKIDLKTTQDKLKISTGKYNCIINGVASDEFPELPVVDEKITPISVNVDIFKHAVSQVLISSSNDTTRPILTGVLWTTHEGELLLASTDGYRLSEKKLLKTKKDLSVIIPTTTLQEVLRSITDTTEDIEIFFDDIQVKFKLHDLEITSKLIDGNFPNYKQLIPSKNEVKAIVDRKEFIRIAKISNLFSRNIGGSVTFEINEDKQELSAKSIESELGENTSEIGAEVSGSGKITINSKYINEVLPVLDSEKIEIGFNGKISPCLIKPIDDKKDYQHIIMPLKS